MIDERPGVLVRQDKTLDESVGYAVKLQGSIKLDSVGIIASRLMLVVIPAAPANHPANRCPQRRASNAGREENVLAVHQPLRWPQESVLPLEHPL